MCHVVMHLNNKPVIVTPLLCLLFCSCHLCLQFKRHKTKQHTRNFAKSVVNLVDAVSKHFNDPLRSMCCLSLIHIHYKLCTLTSVVFIGRTSCLALAMEMSVSLVHTEISQIHIPQCINIMTGFISSATSSNVYLVFISLM